jgi:hypothetical protein
MTTESFETDDDALHRDRREHGGSPARPDDDALASRTEAERVELGLDDYDPENVPPATDDAPPADPTDTDENREAAAEISREMSEGELYPLTEKHPFPPTHYDRS